MGVSWRHQNSSMALSILIALTLFATTFAERGCEDYYFSECHDPPAQQELHVGSLEECIQNCELFGSFGQCDYLLYFKSGPDENCKIISGPGEPDDEMNKYLDACRVAGQPMQNTAGDCLPTPPPYSPDFPKGECSALVCTDDTCADCTADKCADYKGSNCLKLGEDGETTDNIPDYKTCLTFCTGQIEANKFTFLTYDKESKKCICYIDDTSACSIEVVKYGMTIDQVNTCTA